MAYLNVGYEKLLHAIGLQEKELQELELEISCWNCQGKKGIRSPGGGIFCFECGALQEK